MTLNTSSIYATENWTGWVGKDRRRPIAMLRKDKMHFLSWRIALLYIQTSPFDPATPFRMNSASSFVLLLHHLLGLHSGSND